MLKMSNLILGTLLTALCISSFAIADYVEYDAYCPGEPFQYTKGYHTKRSTKPYDDRQKMTICAERPVPPGWVVVGTRYSPNCKGCGRNVLIIQKLSTILNAEILICKGQPIPIGWAVIGEEHNKHAPGRGKNMWRIRRV